MRYPNIVSEFFLIRDFVSKHVELSSRSIFLNVLKGGIDYLLGCIENDKKLENPLSEFFQSIIIAERSNTVSPVKTVKDSRETFNTEIAEIQTTHEKESFKISDISRPINSSSDEYIEEEKETFEFSQRS